MEKIWGFFRNPWVQAGLLGVFLALSLHPRPKQAEAAYQRGLALLPQQPAAALPDLLTAHQAWPERADIALQAAEAAWAAQRPHLALALLRHAATRAPLPAWAYARLSTVHMAVGQPQAALEALQEGLRIHPHHPDLLHRLALLAQAQGDDTLAIAALREAVAQGQVAADDRWRLALLLSAHDPANALPLLESLLDDSAYATQARALRDGLALALRASTPSQQFTLAGEALLAQGYPALAETALRRAIALNPNAPTAWAYLGAALDAQGRDGRTALRHAQRLAPRAPLPNLLLGLHWLNRGQPARALPWLQAAVNADPGNATLHLTLAQALAQTAHNLPRVTEALHRATSQAPYDAQVWRQATQLALNLGLPAAQTLPFARRAVALQPTDPVALTLLGQVLLQAGDVATAQRFFERALTLDPGYAPAHLYLGVTLLAQNHPQAAQEHWLWAARLAPPDSLVARQAQAWLQRTP